MLLMNKQLKNHSYMCILLHSDKKSGLLMFDLVTVGHFAIDTIHLPSGPLPKQVLGGPPTYVSVAAAKLGAKVSVVSKLGEDFSNSYAEWLRNNKVDLSGLRQIRGASTTQFIIDYQKNGSRKLQLKVRAPSIFAEDWPEKLQAKAVHIAPIAGELSEKTVVKLRKLTSILSLDPQGFVRSFDSRGNVSLRHWEGQQVLGQVDVFKSSLNEIKAIAGTNKLNLAMKTISDYGVKTVIVTKSRKGSSLLFDDSFSSVPSYKSKRIVDPTGAGDAFSGAFLAEYVRRRDPLWCACVGTASASFIVEGIGLQRFGEKEETYERAKEIYEKHEKRKP
jgi:sugar/nucleoside kinase (ribokinase family)